MSLRSTTSLCFRMLCFGFIVSAAALSSTAVYAQVTAQTLIGKAVSDDAADKEVTGAINRFRDRDIDGCRAIQFGLRVRRRRRPFEAGEQAFGFVGRESQRPFGRGRRWWLRISRSANDNAQQDEDQSKTESV